MDEIADVESYNIADCRIGVVSFGCTSRVIYEVVENAEAKGVKVSYLGLKTIWPFPEKIVKKLAETAHKIIVPEMNLRQIFYEVERKLKLPFAQDAGGDSR